METWYDLNKGDYPKERGRYLFVDETGKIGVCFYFPESRSVDVIQSVGEGKITFLYKFPPLPR